MVMKQERDSLISPSKPFRKPGAENRLIFLSQLLAEDEVNLKFNPYTSSLPISSLNKKQVTGGAQAKKRKRICK